MAQSTQYPHIHLAAGGSASSPAVLGRFTVHYIEQFGTLGPSVVCPDRVLSHEQTVPTSLPTLHPHAQPRARRSGG